MDDKHNSLNLAARVCSDVCPWTLSVPRGSQFSSSFALGKLLLGTDGVRGRVSEHIFAPNEGYLYHAIENTANENAGKQLYVRQYSTQSSHRSLQFNCITPNLPIVR